MSTGSGYPTGPAVGGAFRLVDHHGAEVTDETYRGSYVLIFFGFTHCKVVCPRALGKLSNVLDSLGSQADQFRPLYITVDPERDNPEAMRSFLEHDYPRFTGLTGSSEQIEAAKKAFRVFARKADDPEDPDGYAVPHSAITYVLDSAGNYVTHFTDAVDEASMTGRLRSLLRD